MKNVIFLIILCFVGISLQAQTFKPKAKAGGFGISVGDEPTNKTCIVEGTEWAVFTTASGTEYIKCLSPKTGNTYPVWLGLVTEFVYNGEPVRVSKRGTHFILVISPKSGNPYPKWLDKST